jgi:hypothetical protein
MEEFKNYYGVTPEIEYQEKMKIIKKLSNKINNNRNEKIEINKLEKKQFVYSIDWLTINLKLNDPADVRVVIEDTYCIKRERGTNVFQNVVDYYNTRDEIVFTIVSNPYSSIIKPDFAQLQIKNKWLYVGNLEKLIYKILFHSNFEYQGISRIDICADLFNFESWDEKNKCYLEPQEFIQLFAKGNIKKNNPSKFTLWGKTEDYNNVYHCLNIGDGQSVFSWKIYNKSKELREVEDKSYVRQKWERDLLNFDKSKDVWRFELSLKNINKILLKNGDYNLNQDLANWLNNYPYYFIIFVQKKFAFKDDMGKFIDFIKLPQHKKEGYELSTNLKGKFDYSPTMKDKGKLINNLINIINKADTKEIAMEYIEKIKDYIQEEDYYYIFTSKGYNIDLLYSYFVYKFTDDKMKILSTP